MSKKTPGTAPATQPVRVRRGYFECRYGQLHVHNAMPPGGGFEEATALLCVHDCPGSGRVFGPFMQLAGRDRSVYAPDLPGFGESDPPPARAALGDYVGALGDFIDTMRLRRLDVLGLRGGALLATELSLARATQVGRLVLVSPGAGTGARAASAPAAPEPQRWVMEALAQYPLRERLARLTQKLLVLRPQDEAREASGARPQDLPAGRVVDLDVPAAELFGTAAPRLIEAVRDFLRG
jgi:pimeloyl-ACP methyl ester carboxylesterase